MSAINDAGEMRRDGGERHPLDGGLERGIAQESLILDVLLGGEEPAIPAEDMVAVREALGKLREGKALKQTEDRAVKRWRKARETALRVKLCRSVPKSVYLEWSGKSASHAVRLSETYGAPVNGEEGVDLIKLVRWINDFLAAHWKPLELARKDGDGGNAATALKEVKLRREKLKLAEIEGELVRVDLITRDLMDFAAALRRACEIVQPNAGPATMQKVHEVMDEYLARMRQKYSKAFPLLKSDEVQT